MIKAMALPDGSIIEDENLILHDVYNHYRLLYRKDTNNIARFDVAQREVLALIQKKFSREDNRILGALPSREEIERIV